MLSTNRVNHVFPFPLSTAEIIGDYMSNMDCTKNVRCAFPVHDYSVRQQASAL
jgi:hypothetical protein